MFSRLGSSLGAACRPRPPRGVEARLSRQRRVRPASQPGPWRALVRPLASLAGRGLGLATLVALVTVGLLAGYTALACSEGFMVRRAEVTGTRTLSRLAVLRAAGIGADQSLVTLPVGRIEAGVRKLGWVSEARVARHWPDGVAIEVSEREPSFLALVEGELCWVAREAAAFWPLEGEPAPDAFIVTGLGKADLIGPDPEVRALVAALERLQAELPAAPAGLPGEIAEVHLDRVWGLCLVLNQAPATVRLGLEGFPSRLERLQRVLADLRERGELGRALLIDLTPERRVVVRLGREAA